MFSVFDLYLYLYKGEWVINSNVMINKYSKVNNG